MSDKVPVRGQVWVDGPQNTGLLPQETVIRVPRETMSGGALLWFDVTLCQLTLLR